MGVATIAQRSLEVTGPIIAARVVHVDDELTLITTQGQAIRFKVKAVRHTGRSAMGTRLIDLAEGDSVASVARLAAADLAPRGPEPAAAPAVEAEPPAVAVGENGKDGG
jgi:DNA gyrase subunit A